MRNVGQGHAPPPGLVRAVGQGHALPPGLVRRVQRVFNPPLPLLAGLLLLASCQPLLQTSVRIHPDLESLIPADTVYLFGANMEQLRNLPEYQKLAHLALPQLDSVSRETGIDPRKDIQEFLGCSNGTSMVTMVRGTFTAADLEGKLRARGVSGVPYKGHNLYGTDQAGITFLSPSILAGGSTAVLKSMIDNLGAEHSLPGALRPLLEAVPGRDQIWAVSAAGIPTPGMGTHEGSRPGDITGRLGDISGMLRGIQAVVLGVDLSKGLNLTARLDCRTEDDARHVHDALRGAIGMARLSTPDNQPELLKVYDAIQVTQGNSRVDVSGDLPSDQVDRVLTLWLKKSL
jgi:hypothetical protein